MFKVSRGYGDSDLMQADDPYKLSRRSLFNNQDTVTEFGLNDMNADYKKSADPYKSSKSLSRRSLSNNQNTNSELGLNEQMGSTAAFGRLSETARIPNCRLSGQGGANRLGELSKLSGNSGARRVSTPNGAGERREFNSGSASEGSSKPYDGRGRRGGPQLGRLGEFSGQGKFRGNGEMGGIGGNDGLQLGRLGEFGGQGKFSGNGEISGIGGSGGMSGIGETGRLSGSNGFSGIGGLRESSGINNVGGISGTGEEFKSMPFN